MTSSIPLFSLNHRAGAAAQQPRQIFPHRLHYSRVGKCTVKMWSFPEGEWGAGAVHEPPVAVPEVRQGSQARQETSKSSPLAIIRARSVSVGRYEANS